MTYRKTSTSYISPHLGLEGAIPFRPLPSSPSPYKTRASASHCGLSLVPANLQNVPTWSPTPAPPWTGESHQLSGSIHGFFLVLGITHISRLAHVMIVGGYRMRQAHMPAHRWVTAHDAIVSANLLVREDDLQRRWTAPQNSGGRVWWVSGASSKQDRLGAPGANGNTPRLGSQMLWMAGVGRVPRIPHDD